MVHNIDDNNAVSFLRDNPTVVIDCFATWCGPCKMFGSIFERLANKMPGVKFVKLDIDKAKAVAGHLSVKSVPTIVIVKNNTIVFKKSGVLNESQLMEVIKQHIG